MILNRCGHLWDRGLARLRRESPQPFEFTSTANQRGIWNLENLDLSQLVADKADEFLFVWSPLKMKAQPGRRQSDGSVLGRRGG